VLISLTVTGPGWRVSDEVRAGTEVRDGLFGRGVRDGFFKKRKGKKRGKLKRIQKYKKKNIFFLVFLKCFPELGRPKREED
jgi:hypothetical protein